MSGILAIIAMVSCIVLCWPDLLADQNQSVAFSIVTSVYFTFVAFMLMWSLINLLLTIRRNNLPKEVGRELGKIIIFLVYYSLAFAFRAVAVTLAFFEIWPQFNRTW